MQRWRLPVVREQSEGRFGFQPPCCTVHSGFFLWCGFFLVCLLFFLTESFMLEGTSWSSSPILFKQGHLEQADQDCVYLGFQYLHGWRWLSFSGQAVPEFDHLHNKKVFYCFQTDSSVSVCAHWLLLSVSTAEKSLSPFSSFALIGYLIDKSPLSLLQVGDAPVSIFPSGALRVWVSAPQAGPGSGTALLWTFNCTFFHSTSGRTH